MHDLWRGKYRKVMFTRGKTGDTIFLTVMESQFDEKHTYLKYELKKVKKKVGSTYEPKQVAHRAAA